MRRYRLIFKNRRDFEQSRLFLCGFAFPTFAAVIATWWLS